MGARADLAAAFVVALDDAGLEANVYDHPADLIALPAIAIDAAPDYITPATYGAAGPGAYMWQFVIHLTVARSDVASGFTTLEEMRAVLVPACNELGAQVGPMSSPETIQQNDQPTLQSALDIEWLTERTT